MNKREHKIKPVNKMQPATAPVWFIDYRAQENIVGALVM
jgi:hypothetical protein